MDGVALSVSTPHMCFSGRDAREESDDEAQVLDHSHSIIALDEPSGVQSLENRG